MCAWYLSSEENYASRKYVPIYHLLYMYLHCFWYSVTGLRGMNFLIPCTRIWLVRDIQTLPCVAVFFMMHIMSVTVVSHPPPPHPTTFLLTVKLSTFGGQIQNCSCRKGNQHFYNIAIVHIDYYSREIDTGFL